MVGVEESEPAVGTAILGGQHATNGGIQIRVQFKDAVAHVMMREDGESVSMAVSAGIVRDYAWSERNTQSRNYEGN